MNIVKMLGFNKSQKKEIKIKVLQEEQSNQNKRVSIVKNPFDNKRVKSVHLGWTSGWGSRRPYWYGTVEFENGETSGRQRLKDTPDFENICTQVQILMESLQK